MADPYLHFLVECEKKMRQIANERLEEIRAEVAEGIAQAIEALGDRGYGMYRRAIDEAAELARGYTQPAETPGHRDGTPAAPVQPTQERPLS